MRLRSDDELHDSLSRGNSLTLSPGLSQFEPGRLNKKFTSKFESETDLAGERGRPPSKKLITLDQILIKDYSASDEMSLKERELEELKEIRKNWVPPETSPKISSAISDKTSPSARNSVKARWNPVSMESRAEKSQSL